MKNPKKYIKIHKTEPKNFETFLGMKFIYKFMYEATDNHDIF